MKTEANTVLITGGGSGIGLEIAKRFSDLGNKVIITGRDEHKLKNAVQTMRNASYIVCDVTSEADVDRMIYQLNKETGGINILVNNAGEAHLQNLAEQRVYKNAASEMTTNYLSVVRLTEGLLPQMAKKENAAVINVSSVVAFSPAKNLPTYSASKAALHSYTQVLRHSLKKSAIKVFELMPPLVDTGMTKNIPSKTKLDPSVVADELMSALNADEYEIKVGSTKDFYKLYLSGPEKAFEYLNAN